MSCKVTIHEASCAMKANLQFIDYDKVGCDEWAIIEKACTLIKHGDNYYLSLVDGATGDPKLGSNTDFSDGMTASEGIKALASCGAEEFDLCEELKTKFVDNGNKIGG